MDKYEKENYLECVTQIISGMIIQADEVGKSLGFEVRSLTLRDMSKDADCDWEMDCTGPFSSLKEIEKEADPFDRKKFMDEFNDRMEKEGY